MIVSVASGKGGTGKTTVALMMALGSVRTELVDCDVEEPNCHLFLRPELECVKEVEVRIPSIVLERCNSCGACVKVCRFAALVMAGGKPMLFPELCHSCGGCVLACAERAILEAPRRIGRLEIGTGSGIYDHVRWLSGKLDPGVPAGGPLIKAVKAEVTDCENTILDCPPGTSCSMALAVHGSDVCLLVTEPNAFGLHDLELAMDVVAELGIGTCGVIVNKSEPGLWRGKIQDLCFRKNIPVLMDIPYSREWAEQYASGVLSGEAVEMGRRIWEEVRKTWRQR